MTQPKPMTADGGRADRSAFLSPTLVEFQLNPFRVLGLPVTAGADESVWRAEELLTLLRAGIARPEPDALPWLPTPGEPEIRQALQVAEEPIRRLVARLSWFDLEEDPEGDALGRLLGSLDRAEVAAQLAGPSSGTYELAGPTPQADGVVPAINRANLFLLLAGLGTSEVGPGRPAPRAPSGPVSLRWTRRTVEAGPAVDARDRRGVPADPGLGPDEALPTTGVWSVQDPHDAFEDERAGSAGRALAGAWRRGLEEWSRLLEDPRFLDHLRGCLDGLGDDLVGPDDAESVVEMLRMRLVDLLAGEVKAATLSGRSDRVADLLRVADETLPTRAGEVVSHPPTAEELSSSAGPSTAANGRPAGPPGIDRKLWEMALRPVRPRLKAEAADLDELLGDEPHGLDDVELYLDRAESMAGRWAALDPSDILGLREIADAAILKAVDLLARHQDFATIDRVTALLKRAGLAADAESIKRRAESAAARVEEQRQFACYYCNAREMDHKCSATLRGKKLVDVTRRGNTTTYHYTIKHDFVHRCGPCAALHHYLYRTASWAWIGLGPAMAMGGFLIFRYLFPYAMEANHPGTDGSAIPFFVCLGLLAGYVGIYFGSGYWAREFLANRLTPPGDRLYSDAKGAKQYQSLKAEGYEIEVDFARGAVDRAIKESRSLPTAS